MSSDRLVNIIFSYEPMACGFKKKAMIALFQALPDDAEVVCIGEIYNSLSSYIRIRSEKFCSVSECEIIPDVVPEFIYHEDGSVYCTIDLSKVMRIDTNNKIALETVNPYDIVYLFNKPFMDQVDGNRELQTYLKSIADSMLVRLENNRYWFGDYGDRSNELYFNQKMDQESYNESLKEMNECPHSWKTYVGFTEQYDYCLHCDTKKT